MGQKKNILQRMTDGLDLGEEPAPGQPLIEIAGEHRVLIENHSGVLEYTRERICVSVKYGIAAVCGCSLELKRMSREQLVISGKIESISLHRRKL